jgi:hypothetical protein
VKCTRSIKSWWSCEAIDVGETQLALRTLARFPFLIRSAVLKPRSAKATFRNRRFSVPNLRVADYLSAQRPASAQAWDEPQAII